MTEKLKNGRDTVRIRELEEKVTTLTASLQKVTAEKDQLCREVNALRVSLAEKEEAHKKDIATLQPIREERDVYYRSLLHHLGGDFTFTKQEIDDILKNGVSFESAPEELGVLEKRK